MDLHSLLAQPFWTALGETLLHFLWQGLLISAVLWLVLRWIPVTFSAPRHAACVLAYVGYLVWPGYTLYGLLASNQQVTPLIESGIRWLSGPPVTPSAVIYAAKDSSGGILPFSSLEWLLVAISAAWVVMVLLLSIRGLRELKHSYSLIHLNTRPIGGELARRFPRIQRIMGIRRQVRLLQSSIISVPMVIGWLKPVILLPVATTLQLTLPQLEMVLAHELAHVRRNDFVINLLQTLVETLFFFHPCVHWASRQLRTEREHRCDDAVLAVYQDDIAYAKALTECEASREDAPAFAMAVTGGELRRRIERLMARRKAPHRRFSHLLTLLLSFGMVSALAHNVSESWLSSRDLPTSRVSPAHNPLASVTSTSVNERALTDVTATPRQQVPWEPAEVTANGPQLIAAKDSVTAAEAVESASNQVPRASNESPRSIIRTTRTPVLPAREQMPTASVVHEPVSAQKVTEGNPVEAKVMESASIASSASESNASASSLAQRKAEKERAFTSEPEEPIAAKSVVAKVVPKREVSQGRTSPDSGRAKEAQQNTLHLAMNSPAQTAPLDLSTASSVNSNAVQKIVPATPLHTPLPHFPRANLLKGNTAEIRVTFEVSSNGRVTDIEFESRENPRFNRAIKKALKNWRFEPAQENGKKVASQESRVFDFKPPENHRDFIKPTTGSHLN